MSQQDENIVMYENVKTIACLSLNKYSLYNDFMEQLQLSSNIYNSKKNKTTLKFYNTDNFTDIELSYQCRSVDIVIFLVTENNFTDDKMSMVLKNIPSYMFCCLDDNTKFTKKYVEKNFGDEIVKIRQVIDKLCSCKIKNTKIYSSRPSFIIDQIQYENDGFYYTQAMIRNNLHGNKIIINGIDEFEIVEIKNNMIQIAKHDAEDIFEEKRSIKEYCISDEKHQHVNEYEDMDIENENDTQDYNKNTDSNGYEDMDIDEGSNSSCFEKDLIEKYNDYCMVKNLKTSTFITNAYPKYYQQISLFENIKKIEKEFVTMMNKPYIQTELKLKRLTNKQDLSTAKTYVCYNIYDFENKLTIYNMEFSSTEELQTNCEYIADFGHFIMPITVIISSISNSNLHKCLKSAKTGVITFIAPLVLNLNKILLFKESYNNKNMIGQAMNNSYKERVILEEVNIIGKAKKIDKRYCTVTKMFNSKEEVLYYRNMPLVCNNGNTGIIKKPIGTYGLFKAYFCKPVTHEDKITIKLYKRVFPKMLNL